MNLLNYHHLRYFWAVARRGSLTRASEDLFLTPQTVSSQIRELEVALGEALFDRTGRRMELTEVGQEVFRYADDIFRLGRDLMAMVRQKDVRRPLRLTVGVADALPKLVAYRLLAPALALGEPVQLVCLEATAERLLADLAAHELDIVLSDSPASPKVKVQAFSHLLGECGVTFMGNARLAATVRRRGFPAGLDGMPFLMPTGNARIRPELDQWFARNEVRPKIVGEFADSALLKVFGQAGGGVFPVLSLIEGEVARQHRVRPIGTADGLVERFYVLSPERRLKHPAVVAILEAARLEQTA